MSTLVRLEFVQLIRSGWVRILLAAFLALTVFALWVGAVEHTRWTRAVSAVRAETERVIAREKENVVLQRQEGFSPPGAPNAQAMDATLPPAAGVVVAVGDAPQRAFTATINTNTRADTLFKNVETTSPLSASLGTLDLTWAAIVLLPLLVIALTHDLLAGERDTARIGLLRAQTGSMGQLVVRRLWVRLTVPLIVLSAGALVAPALGATPKVIVWWWLIASAYVVLWGVIAAWISVRTRSSQSAAAVLLLLWLTFVIVVPSVLTMVVERLAPVPSRLTQVIAMREVQLGLQQRTAQLLDRFLVDHPELAGASRTGFARSSFVAQRETESQLAPVLARYAQARERQMSWGAALSWLSPSMFAHASLTHIAGTDSARHDEFVGQANAFAAGWRAHLRDPLFLGRNLTPEELDALPRFQFEEPQLSGRAPLSLAYMVALIGMASWMLRRALRAGDLR